MPLFLIFEFFRSDAFNPRNIQEQSSLAFEKSNTLYNIATYISNEAISGSQVFNLKTSVRELCVSATIFDWISKNFSNAPLPDISSEFSSFMSELCLLQAQELAFFSSLNEEKSLKILVRLSLGLMDLLKRVQYQLSNLKYTTLEPFMKHVEAKSTLHTFIHCLLMAEFWDTQELYDISYDLFITALKIFDTLKIENREQVRDYLKISLMRSEKEREQISYEGKKASESTIQIEPFYLAAIMNFRTVIKPYVSTFRSSFAVFYPIHIVQLQSEFESKAETISRTLERAIEEILINYGSIVSRADVKISDFILDVRNIIIGNPDVHVQSLNEILNLINSVQNVKKSMIYNNFILEDSTDLQEIWNSFKKSTETLEILKIRLVLDDSTFVQSMSPIFKDSYESIQKSLSESLEEYLKNSKKQDEMFENLKKEIKSVDLRESLLGSDNHASIINDKINSLDNSAIEVLRVIESQKKLAAHIADIWSDSIKSGSGKMITIIPNMVDISKNLDLIRNDLNEMMTKISIITENQRNNQESNNISFKSKLIDLLNKY